MSGAGDDNASESGEGGGEGDSASAALPPSPAPPGVVLGVVAVLDACVLYPASLRDLFVTLAVGGLYLPRWTDTIHAEWPAPTRRATIGETRAC